MGQLSLSPMGTGVSKELEVLDADLSPEHPPSPGRQSRKDQAGTCQDIAQTWLDYQHLP